MLIRNYSKRSKSGKVLSQAPSEMLVRHCSKSSRCWIIPMHQPCRVHREQPASDVAKHWIDRFCLAETVAQEAEHALQKSKNELKPSGTLQGAVISRLSSRQSWLSRPCMITSKQHRAVLIRPSISCSSQLRLHSSRQTKRSKLCKSSGQAAWLWHSFRSRKQHIGSNS